MKSFARKLFAATAFASLLPVASAAVLTFDDLPGTDYFQANTPYNGFVFGTDNGFPSTSTDWFWSNIGTGPGDPYPAKSPATNISTCPNDPSTPDPLDCLQRIGADQQAISAASDFIFDGAWFSGFDTVQFKLYQGASLVHTSGVSPLLDGNPPVFLASGYAGPVNRVVVNASDNFFAMDDFTYRLIPTGTVPEPGSLLLAVGALGLLAASRRRRTN